MLGCVCRSVCCFSDLLFVLRHWKGRNGTFRVRVVCPFSLFFVGGVVWFEKVSSTFCFSGVFCMICLYVGTCLGVLRFNCVL